tara:strand:- start:41245 stop:41601 length:357 start_codon:yes stop_codon:yes gene_type:complete
MHDESKVGPGRSIRQSNENVGRYANAKGRTMIDIDNILTAWLRSGEVRDYFTQVLREAVNTELGEIMNGELLDVAEAAKLLSMTEGAVRKASERGQLPCVRLDRRLRFRRSELLALGR